MSSALNGFRLLHLREMRRHPVRALLAVVALGAGVALTVAAALLVTSIQQTYRGVLRSLAGPAQLRVIGSARDQAWITDRDLEGVAHAEGVASVVPLVHTVATLRGSATDEMFTLVVGADCRAARLVKLKTCDQRVLDSFTGDAPIAMSASLKRSLGANPTIRTDVGLVSLRDVPALRQLDGYNHGSVVLFPLRTAQRVFSRGDRYDELAVTVSDPGRIEHVRHAIGRVVGPGAAVIGAEQLTRAQFSAGPLIPLLGLVVVMAMGLAGLLVYNIASLALAERRRDLAVAGALGFAPRSLALGALADAAVLGVGGGVIGVVLGIVFAHPMINATATAAVDHFIGTRVFLHIAPGVLVAGLLIAVVTSVVAALIPVRRTLRFDLAAEVHGRAVPEEDERSRSFVRIAVLGSISAVAIALSFLASRKGALEPWQPLVGMLSLMSTAFFVFAFCGALTPRLAGALARSRAIGGTLRLALANLASRPRRTASLASAVAAAVGTACVLGALIPAVRGEITGSFGAIVDGRVWVSTTSSVNDAGANIRIPTATVERLRRLPRVASVGELRCVREGDAAGPIELCSAARMRRVPLPVVAGSASQRELDGGGAFIATGVARTRALRPGSMLRVATPNGFRKIPVAAVWANPNFNGYVVTVSSQTMTRLFGPGPPGQLLVRPTRGVSPEALAREILAARIDPDLQALAPHAMTQELGSEIALQVEPFWMLQRILLFVALVATLSVFLLVGVQRRRELGILGANGFGPRGLAAMTIAEAIAIGTGGGLLGIIGGTGLFEVLRNIAVASVGTTAPFRFALSTALVSTGVAVVVVAVGGALPAWRTSRLEIVAAIRDE